MRGHNIVADGWAGASNPHTHHPPPHTYSQTQTVTTGASKMRVFAIFNSITTDRPTDGRTDGRTDTPSYRDARTHLKRSRFIYLRTIVVGRVTMKKKSLNLLVNV